MRNDNGGAGADTIKSTMTSPSSDASDFGGGATFTASGADFASSTTCSELVATK